MGGCHCLLLASLRFWAGAGGRACQQCGRQLASAHAAVPAPPASPSPQPERSWPACPPVHLSLQTAARRCSAQTFWSEAALTPSWSAGCWTEAPTRLPLCRAALPDSPAPVCWPARPAGAAGARRAAAARRCLRRGCCCTSFSRSCTSAASCPSCTRRRAAGRRPGCCAEPPTACSACWRQGRRLRGPPISAVSLRQLFRPCSRATGLRCEVPRCSRQSGCRNGTTCFPGPSGRPPARCCWWHAAASACQPALRQAARAGAAAALAAATCGGPGAARLSEDRLRTPLTAALAGRVCRRRRT